MPVYPHVIDNGDGTSAARVGANQGSLTNRSGTITNGNTAQQLAAANTSRRYLIVQNQSIGPLYIDFGATAVVGQPSVTLAACTLANDGTGGVYEFPPTFVSTQSVSIIGATTGQAFTAKEG